MKKTIALLAAAAMIIATACENKENVAGKDGDMTYKEMLTKASDAVSIGFDALPQAIADALAASEYASWTVTEVDAIYRNGEIILYEIELEDGAGTEVEILFDLDGTILNVKIDAADTNDTPETPADGEALPLDIRAKVLEMYPDAVILEIDREKNGFEVEIFWNGNEMDVDFTLEGVWLRSESEIAISDVPQVVIDAVKAAYPGCIFDDDEADFVSTPDGDWYEFEIEVPASDEEYELTVASDGTILKAELDD